MKRILSSPSPIEISQLKYMLEEAGITCFVRNEISAALSGEIPINESTPELWVNEDAKFVEAQRIKRIWKTPPATAERAWTCPSCKEVSEPQFASCWKCGADKPQA